MDFDAVIVGAGIAGLVTALNLAPFRRVLLIERNAGTAWRIGKSLPGAARHLLSDMGLLAAFDRDGHLPRHAFRSAWGDGGPFVRDALTDPDGHGWQIDRARFEQGLRAEATRRGATLAVPARLTAIEPVEEGWRVGFSLRGQSFLVASRLVIDAAGARSRWLASHGARRRIFDRLCCSWVRTSGAALRAGVVHIEAEKEGWWYAAPIPDDGNILAFHTDSNLPAARAGRTLPALMSRARKLPILGPLLGDRCWDDGEHGYCAAHTAWADPAAGETWLTVGDAALSFDPLAAQGLFAALYLGLAAAEAAHRSLDGEKAALPSYAAEVIRIRDAYLAQRAAWYALETRWAEQPFWRRRHASWPASPGDRPSLAGQGVTPFMII